MRLIWYAASLAAFAAADYCTTSAKSKRDCKLCKLEYQNDKSACVNARGPCVWNETGSLDDSPHTDTECDSSYGDADDSGGTPDGGGGGGGGGRTKTKPPRQLRSA